MSNEEAAQVQNECSIDEVLRWMCCRTTKDTIKKKSTAHAEGGREGGHLHMGGEFTCTCGEGVLENME